MNFGKLLKFAIPATLFAAIVFQWEKSYTSASGADPSYTGAPSEGNCTSCHSGTASTSSSTIILKKNGSTSNLEYVPDSTYTITLDFNPSGAGRRGFQVTALRTSNNTFAGTFTVTDNTNTQKKSNSINSSNRDYITHTSSGFSKTSWSFDWKAPSTNVGNIKFYVSANAADGGGSNANDKIHLNEFTFSPSKNLPVASISSTPTAFCVGDTIYFSGSGTNNPTSYKWTFSSGHITSSTAQNPKVKTNKNGVLTATLVVTNAYASSPAAQKQINIASLPTDTIGVAGSTTICDGDSVKLTATPGSKYLWNNGKTSQSIYAKTADTFNVLVTSSGGCATQSKDVVINVLEKPTSTLVMQHGNDTICTGDSLVFDASSGLVNYDFYDKTAVVQNGASTTYTAKNLANGKHTFFMIATGQNGCKTDTSAIYNVFVKNRLNQPFAFCGTSTTGSVTITWNAVSLAAGYEVSADSGKTWETPSSGTKGLTHTETGLPENTSVNMRIRAIDYTACKYGNTGNVTCKTLPCSQLTYNLTYDELVCPGTSADVNFSNFSSSKYFIRVDGGAPVKTTQFSYNPTADTTITFSLYDSAKINCAAIIETVTIKVDQLPDINFRAAKNSFCSNEDVVLMAGGGYASYVFYKNNNEVNTITDSVYTSSGVFADGDIVHVKGITANGCEKVSAPISININAAPEAGFTMNADKLVVDFNDTTANAASRVWDFGDGDTSSAKSPQHTYSVEGTYNVKLTVTGANGCVTEISKPVTVKTIGIKEVKFADKLSVQPNPASDIITVTAQLNQPKSITIYITDIRGKRVYEAPAKTYTNGKLNVQIPVSHFSPGIYMLYLQSGNQLMNYKLIRSQER